MVQVAGLADTLLSTALPGQGGPERQVSLPGTGRATQHGDGTVRVQYEDGAGLAVRDGATTVQQWSPLLSTVQCGCRWSTARAPARCGSSTG